MTDSSLYPGFAKIHYNSGGHAHVQILPLLPYQGVGGAWFVQYKSSSIGDTFANAMAAWAAVLKLFIVTTGSIVDAELWTLASVGADPIYRETVALNIAGTNAAASLARGQWALTLRTQLGGLLRIYIMEASVAIDTIYPPPFAGIIASIVNLLIGANGMVVGRDGSFPVVGIRAVSKENDALRKKYLLNV